MTPFAALTVFVNTDLVAIRKAENKIAISSTPTVHDKVVEFAHLREVLGNYRKADKTVVLCHGVFDLLHIGHIWHLQEAKQQGDVLVVTVTPDEFVNKGPGRPVFGHKLRAQALAALGVVDFVAVSQSPDAVPIISSLKPDVYVKGPDYQKVSDDRTGKIVAEQAAVEHLGGRIHFTRTETHSSSKLLNEHFSDQPKQTQIFIQSLRNRYTPSDIGNYISAAQTKSALVVGEAIVDEYQYCEAIGKSSKDPTLVVKQLTKERFAGGVLAIANHVADFTKRVSIVTQLGSRASYSDFIAQALHANVQLTPVIRSNAPTIVKRRFIDAYSFTKLFETYDINDAALEDQDEQAIRSVLDQALGSNDIIIVADYGHGMFTPAIIETIRKQARYLAVNVQSNAGNFGYQTLQKYTGVHHISVDENELRLEVRDRRGDIRQIMERAIQTLKCKSMIVTRGKYGCLCYREGDGIIEIPALASTIVDRVGAGDAFLSITALLLAQDAPLDVVGFVGNAGGSQAVATVGNKQSLELVSLMKYIDRLLK